MEYFRQGRAALVLALIAFSITPTVAGVVTEAETIRIFLEQSPQARRVTTIERSVDAALRGESLVENPDVSYQVEDVAGVRDEFLTVQQVLPISGRRGLLKQRAEVAATAAAQQAQGELRSDLHALRQSFHEVLFRERVLQTLRSGAELLTHSVELVDLREREGEGAGYDLLRAEQELVESQITSERAALAVETARSRFGSFFDPELGMQMATLDGDLMPAGPLPNVEQATTRALDQRMELRALSSQGRRLELESRAARRRRIPEPLVTAGWKRSQALGISDTGFVAAVTIPLPIFNRGGLDLARATAEGERIGLDSEIATRSIRADVEMAVAREQTARMVADRYDVEVDRRAAALNRIARLKYEEGESGILELLDAHRTALEMQLRALNARYEAKSAEIDRNRIVGNEVTP